MPHLSWKEVRDRAIRFSREHAGDRSESAEKQTFWNDFFSVFGLRRASLASFEENVRNLKGNTGAIDLLWKGRLLVEHKSFGEDLALAGTQAFTYIKDLTREIAGRKSHATFSSLILPALRFTISSPRSSATSRSLRARSLLITLRFRVSTDLSGTSSSCWARRVSGSIPKIRQTKSLRSHV